jgi:hypothetical protein
MIVAVCTAALPTGKFSVLLVLQQQLLCVFSLQPEPLCCLKLFGGWIWSAGEHSALQVF